MTTNPRKCTQCGDVVPDSQGKKTVCSIECERSRRSIWQRNWVGKNPEKYRADVNKRNKKRRTETKQAAELTSITVPPLIISEISITPADLIVGAEYETTRDSIFRYIGPDRNGFVFAGASNHYYFANDKLQFLVDKKLVAIIRRKPRHYSLTEWYNIYLDDEGNLQSHGGYRSRAEADKFHNNNLKRVACIGRTFEFEENEGL